MTDAAPSPAAPPPPPPPAATESWRDSSGLSDDLRGNASLLDIPDIPTLAQRFIDTKAMVGNRIALPDDTPQAFAKFAEAIRPKEAADYKIDVPEGFGSEFADHMRGIFYENGVHVKSVENIVKGFNDYNLGEIAKKEAADKQSVDDFKAGYKGDFDGDVQRAQETLQGLGAPDEAVQELGHKWGSPALLSWAIGLADKVGPLGYVEGDLPPGVAEFASLAPDAANNKLDELQASAEWREKAKVKGSPEANQRAALLRAASKPQQQNRS